MKVVFSPITPIFIGSGEVYYPQDFFIDEDDNFYFIDREKFLDVVTQEGKLDEFIQKSEDIKKLLGFIDDNFKPNMALDKIEVDSEVADDLFDTISRPVDAFIKDKYYFKPIIPGSSLKGAIKTAVLDYKISKFKSQIEECANKELKNITEKELEAIIFCNENRNRQDKLQSEPKKDMFKALFVDDFKAKNYKLRVLKPKNRPYKNKKDNTIPVVLECLVDGEFEGDIRIDNNLIRQDSSLKYNRYFQGDEYLSYELIQKALKHFFKKIIDKENSRFKVNKIDYEEYLIKLGKHAGAGSKSLNDLRKIYIRQLKKEFEYQLSVWIDKNENPLGWAKLEFKD